MRKPRRVYRVVPRSSGWAIVTQNTKLSWHTKKSSAIQHARAAAKRWMPSQLVICGKNGKVQKEYTYGDDPSPPKG